MHKKAFILLHLLMCFWLTSQTSQSAITPGDTALYQVASSVEGQEPVVTHVRLTALQPESGSRMAHWQMDVTRRDERSFSVFCVSQNYPLGGNARNVGKVERYMLRVDDGSILDYRDVHKGGPLLPRQPFHTVLMPIPLPATMEGWPDEFLPGGSYLGHALVLQERSRETPRPLPSDVKILELDYSLLVGTSRPFKDDGQPRSTPEDDYNYVPFTQEDFDRLIDAGHNYFIPAPNQMEWLWERPVFITTRPERNNLTRYPELLYRSNWFMSLPFYDEPAVRFGWEMPPGTDVNNPEGLAHALKMRARAHAKDGPRSGNYFLHHALHSLGIPQGALNLREPFIPIWETSYDTASYQYSGGAEGLVHEGRYNLWEIEWLARQLIGSGLYPDAEELMLFHYGYLRGAARVFGGSWGMSIYGQSDPRLRFYAMQKAYKMGAQYIWFWTSDHDHHMPFVDQVKLAADLKEMVDGSPKRDMDSLKFAADTAIVMPYGYTISPGHWGAWSPIQPGHINPQGFPHRDVQARFFYEFFRAHRSGHSVDLLVDHEQILNAGYKRIVFVQRDGSIREYENGRPVSDAPVTMATGTMEAEIRPLQPNPVPEDAVVISATDVSGNPPTIDGNVDDWEDAHWFDMSKHLLGEPLSLERYSAKGSVAADDDSLYLAVEVQDEIHHAPLSGWYIWQNDCVQFAIDPLGIRSTSGYTWADHEIGFSLTDEGPQVYRWHSPWNHPSRLSESSLSDENWTADFPLAIVRDDAEMVTRYEAAIPWEMLWPVEMGSGNWVGFNIVVNDNDATSGDDGIALRERVIGLSEGLAGPKNPGRFVALKLPERSVETGWNAMASMPRNAWSTNYALKAQIEWQVQVPEETDVRIVATAFDDRNRPQAIWSTEMTIAEGFQQIDVQLDRAILPHGRYRMNLAIESGGQKMAEQDFRIFVFPPGGTFTVPEL